MHPSDNPPPPDSIPLRPAPSPRFYIPPCSLGESPRLARRYYMRKTNTKEGKRGRGDRKRIRCRSIPFPPRPLSPSPPLPGLEIRERSGLGPKGKRVICTVGGVACITRHSAPSEDGTVTHLALPSSRRPLTHPPPPFLLSPSST